MAPQHRKKKKSEDSASTTGREERNRHRLEKIQRDEQRTLER